jgi:hypothetical protein
VGNKTLVERVRENFHPRSDELLQLYNTAPALGVGQPRPWRPVGHRLVQERVRDSVGVRPAAVEASTTLRTIRAGGWMQEGVDPGSYLVTDEGHRLREEVQAFTNELFATYEVALAAMAAKVGLHVSPGTLRHQTMNGMATLAELCLRRGHIRKADSFGGLVPDLDRAGRGVIDAAASGGDHPALVEDVLRLACSGAHPVLRRMLSHVTALRFVELAVSGGLGERFGAAELAQVGGLHALLDTSSLVQMLESPVRRREAADCFADGSAAGFELLMLRDTDAEFQGAVSHGTRVLTAELRDVVKARLNPRVLEHHQHWAVRAAARHGLAGEMLAEVRSKDDKARLDTVVAFMDGFRDVPLTLRDLGVKTIDPEALSEQRAKHWRRQVAAAKGLDPDDLRCVHDADLMSTGEARRKDAPLTIIVAMDATLAEIHSDVVKEGIVGQLPMVFRMTSASRLFRGLDPTTVPTSGSWGPRATCAAIAVGWVTRFPDLVINCGVGSEVRDDLLVADGAKERSRSERNRRIVADGHAAITQHATVLRFERSIVVAPTEPPVVAKPAPATAPTPAPAPPVRGGAAHRIARFVCLTLATCLAMVAALVLGLDEVLADASVHLPTGQLPGDALVIGLLAWAAAFVRYLRNDDYAELVVNLAGVALAVWSVPNAM